MQDFALILGAIVFASCTISIYTIRRAAGGYQDESGFHYDSTEESDRPPFVTRVRVVPEEPDRPASR